VRQSLQTPYGTPGKSLRVPYNGCVVSD